MSCKDVFLSLSVAATLSSAIQDDSCLVHYTPPPPPTTGSEGSPGGTPPPQTTVPGGPTGGMHHLFVCRTLRMDGWVGRMDRDISNMYAPDN